MLTQKEKNKIHNHITMRNRNCRCVDCGILLSRWDAVRCQKHAKHGKLHPNYIDGRTDNFGYSRKFLNLKLTIRERDNYICQNCDMTEEEHIIVLGSALEVHHIDYDKTNNKKDNLITLCKSCNIRANYNRSHWLAIYQQKMREVTSF